MNDASRIFNLGSESIIFIAMGALFLAFYWIIIFPLALMGPGPDIIVLLLVVGIIWTSFCLVLIALILRSFSSKKGIYSSGSPVEPAGRMYSFTRHRGKVHGGETRVLDKNYCSSCGEPVLEKDQFCGKCRSKLN